MVTLPYVYVLKLDLCVLSYVYTIFSYIDINDCENILYFTDSAPLVYDCNVSNMAIK